MQIAKKISPLLLFTALFLTGCSSLKGKRPPAPKVPLAITITTDNSPDIIGLGVDYYLYNLMDVLDDYPEFDPQLVEVDENPEVVLNLSIENFNIWPRDERVGVRAFSRNIQTGVNTSGQAVYQTVTASAEIVQVTIRSNVRFSTRLTFKNSAPSKVYQQTFSPSYVWQNTFVRSIQGDSRAVDPSIMSGRMMEGIEPTPNDMLLALTKRDLLGRISYEIRTYYQRARK